ncbi:MAG: FkbM family methyltransferase [Phycisphaerales bacterium]|nr:FkbM family methyltransferase [Phycisphaerales bacterium]
MASKPGRTRLVDPGMGHWCIRTSPEGNGPEVDQVSICEILRKYLQPPYVPFLAKIDIEGGEGELFQQDTSWVSQFPLLIVELHDWLIPCQGTSRNFLQCISAMDRDFVCIGENIFSIQHQLVK